MFTLIVLRHLHTDKLSVKKKTYRHLTCKAFLFMINRLEVLHTWNILFAACTVMIRCALHFGLEKVLSLTCTINLISLIRIQSSLFKIIILIRTEVAEHSRVNVTHIFSIPYNRNAKYVNDIIQCFCIRYTTPPKTLSLIEINTLLNQWLIYMQDWLSIPFKCSIGIDWLSISFKCSIFRLRFPYKLNSKYLPNWHFGTNTNKCQTFSGLSFKNFSHMCNTIQTPELLYIGTNFSTVSDV